MSRNLEEWKETKHNRKTPLERKKEQGEKCDDALNRSLVGLLEMRLYTFIFATNTVQQ